MLRSSMGILVLILGLGFLAAGLQPAQAARPDGDDLLLEISPRNILVNEIQGDCVTAHVRNLPYADVAEFTIRLRVDGVSGEIMPTATKPDNQGELVAQFLAVEVKNLLRQLDGATSATIIVSGSTLDGGAFEVSTQVAVKF